MIIYTRATNKKQIKTPEQKIIVPEEDVKIEKEIPSTSTKRAGKKKKNNLSDEKIMKAVEIEQESEDQELAAWIEENLKD